MTDEDSLYVVVAKVVKSHGIRGEVVLESLSDVQGRLDDTSTFILLEQGKRAGELQVESRRFFKNRHVLKFVGISSRSQADLLRDKELAIAESDLGKLSSGQFFIYKLRGMKVRLKNGMEIGTVRDVVKTGGVDLLEVTGAGNEVLIPFTDEICVEVDEKNGRITIDPPEGLLELNAH